MYNVLYPHFLFFSITKKDAGAHCHIPSWGSCHQTEGFCTALPAKSGGNGFKPIPHLFRIFSDEEYIFGYFRLHTVPKDLSVQGASNSGSSRQTWWEITIECSPCLPTNVDSFLSVMMLKKFRYGTLYLIYYILHTIDYIL